MSSFKGSPVCTYTIEQKVHNLNKYGRTLDSVKKDVEALQLWLEKQPHIPKSLGSDEFEQILFTNKFVFNNAKKSIDWYYSIRNIFPDYFKDPDENSMVNILNKFYIFPLPKLTSSNCRVIFIKGINETSNADFDGCSFMACCINLADIIVKYDCPSSKIVVIDCKDLKFEFCLRFSPVIIKTGITIFGKAYHNGMSGIHVINLPPLLEAFYKFIASCLNPKVADRIKIHKNINSIFEFVSRDIFPKDYGGDELSLDELQELWKKELTKNLPWFKQRKVLVTDESLRTEELIDSELLGFQGNFRKLNLD